MSKTQTQADGVASDNVPAVIFSNWREILNQSSLSKGMRGGYALAIGGYLDYCRRNALSVTTETARGYMADVERRQLARQPQLWKDALNWFFRKGKEFSGPVLRGLPSSGQADTGATPWERRLRRCSPGPSASGSSTGWLARPA